jgi:hypothetical protein
MFNHWLAVAAKIVDIHVCGVRSKGQGPNDKSLEETLSDVKTLLGLTTHLSVRKFRSESETGCLVGTEPKGINR